MNKTAANLNPLISRNLSLRNHVSPVSASFTVTLSKLFIVEVSDILFNSLLVITAESIYHPVMSFPLENADHY